MIRMLSVIGVPALLLGGCDTAPPEPAQPGASEAAQNAEAKAPPPPLFNRIVRTNAGDTIPQVTVSDPQGNTLDVAAIGKPVLRNLWATWCGPC